MSVKVALVEYIIRIVPHDGNYAPNISEAAIAVDTMARANLPRRVQAFIETTLLTYRDLDPELLPLGLEVEVEVKS